MKKKITLFLILAGLLLIGSVLFKYNHLLRPKPKNTFEIATTEPVLAEFSFQSDGSNELIKEFKHYQIIIRNDQKLVLKQDQLSKIPDSIPVMITIKIIGENYFYSYKNNALNAIAEGKFDHIIKQLCTEIIGSRANVYIRFNPEMEVPSELYPWQGQLVAYINAYKHFSILCKTLAPKVKQVWAPAGYPGTLEFYPGDDVVDAVSVTLKSESEMLLDVYPKDYPIAYDVRRRIHRLRFVNKPIFIIGSKFSSNDSINSNLVNSVQTFLNSEKDIIYSTKNFNRPAINKSYNPSKELEIGLYDPNSLLVHEKQVTVEHLFVDFGNLYDGSFETNFKDVLKRGHKVIVSFEPFRDPNGKIDLQVLQNLTDKKYDIALTKFYSIIQSTNQIVYLRYAHEMEIPIKRYPWQSQDPIDYIKSFRYFMTFQDPMPSNIKRVWGPAGDRGSLEWWPGNDVVDFMSIAIYGLPDKNITDPEKQESFASIFNRKTWRLRFIDKPIFITEFGVKGPEEYQTKWLEDAAKVIRKNPQVMGVNYFNMTDTPKAWGNIKPPDWSITKNSFSRFSEILLNK